MKTKNRTLIIALLLSVGLNCFLLATYPATNAIPPSIVGTYFSDGNYLVFTEAGEYCFYSPWKFMEEGAYSSEKGNFYKLMPTGDDASWKQVLLQDGELSLLESDGSIYLLPKMNDIPVYDNVRPSYLSPIEKVQP